MASGPGAGRMGHGVLAFYSQGRLVFPCDFRVKIYFFAYFGRSGPIVCENGGGQILSPRAPPVGGALIPGGRGARNTANSVGNGQIFMILVSF